MQFIKLIPEENTLENPSSRQYRRAFLFKNSSKERGNISSFPSWPCFYLVSQIRFFIQNIRIDEDYRQDPYTIYQNDGFHSYIKLNDTVKSIGNKNPELMYFNMFL